MILFKQFADVSRMFELHLQFTCRKPAGWLFLLQEVAEIQTVWSAEPHWAFWSHRLPLLVILLSCRWTFSDSHLFLHSAGRSVLISGFGLGSLRWSRSLCCQSGSWFWSALFLPEKTCVSVLEPCGVRLCKSPPASEPAAPPGSSAQLWGGNSLLSRVL